MRVKKSFQMKAITGMPPHDVQSKEFQQITKTGDNNSLRSHNNHSKATPFITVITVVFNGVETLEKTILSVINQTSKNIEYIIIDGGSDDGTLDIIRKYDYAINFWISESDLGIYDAMNKGIKEANGEYTIFMNSGDLLFDNKVLLEIHSFLIFDLVYGNHALYWGDPHNYKVVDVCAFKDKRNIPFCHQALFTRTKLLKLITFDLQYSIASDYDQYLRLKHMGAKISHVPLVISLYLDGGLSSNSRKKLIKEYYNITKRYNKYYSLLIYIIRLVKFSISGK